VKSNFYRCDFQGIINIKLGFKHKPFVKLRLVDNFQSWMIDRDEKSIKKYIKNNENVT
jgi:hypothetical protein